jgi:hypothetical protein
MKTTLRFIVYASCAILLYSIGCFAQKPYQYKCGTDHVNIMEDKVWVENGDWKKQCELRLEDTNPTFFALVYNTLKDCSLGQKGTCYIWWEKYTRPDGESYPRIIHLSFN